MALRAALPPLQHHEVCSWRARPAAPVCHRISHRSSLPSPDACHDRCVSVASEMRNAGRIRQCPPWADLAKSSARPPDLARWDRDCNVRPRPRRRHTSQLQQTATGSSRGVGSAVSLTCSPCSACRQEEKKGVESLNPGATGPSHPHSIPEAKQPLAPPHPPKGSRMFVESWTSWARVRGR